jgi:hypothetical protein
VAETPIPRLHFPAGPEERARREVTLPTALPSIGDDFDWLLRDFESLRRFMLEELAARFPQRRRWTSSDIEVVLVEALAAVLDQISDKADRVAAEHVLETARRPESVRRLLAFIGYDAVREAGILPPGPATEQAKRLAVAELERAWVREPERMEAARRAGPRSVHRQQRMVGLDDYAQLLERHPLVLRAKARASWSGSWTRIRVAVVAHQEAPLDQALGQGASDSPPTLDPGPRLWDELQAFHKRLGLRLPSLASRPTIRALLELYVESQRMLGHEVELCEPDYVPLELGFQVRVGPRYFRSEINLAVRQALSTGPGGFFAHGRLDFGQSVHHSDLIELLMGLDGVENVVIAPFKRAGDRYADQARAGEIRLAELEIAVCDNDPKRPGFGHYELLLGGGRTG